MLQRNKAIRADVTVLKGNGPGGGVWQRGHLLPTPGADVNPKPGHQEAKGLAHPGAGVGWGLQEHLTSGVAQNLLARLRCCWEVPAHEETRHPILEKLHGGYVPGLQGNKQEGKEEIERSILSIPEQKIGQWRAEEHHIIQPA